MARLASIHEVLIRARDEVVGACQGADTLDDVGRIANYNGLRRHIPRDHCASANDRIAPNCDSRHQRRIGADSRSRFNCLAFDAAGYFRTERVRCIRQDSAGTDPAACLEDCVLWHKGLRVDPDLILNDYMMLDHAMAADGDSIANNAALANESTVTGPKLTADGVARVDDGVGPDRCRRANVRVERPWIRALQWLADDGKIADDAAFTQVYARIQPEYRLRGYGFC